MDLCDESMMKHTTPPCVIVVSETPTVHLITYQSPPPLSLLSLCMTLIQFSGYSHSTDAGPLISKSFVLSCRLDLTNAGNNLPDLCL